MTLKEACEAQGLNYANQVKAHQRRAKGARPMEEYNHERKQQAESKAAILKQLIAEHPTWSNVRLAREMGVTEGYIRKIKKTGLI